MHGETVKKNCCTCLFIYTFNYILYIFFLSWRDSPLVGLGLLLIHEDFCGF
jgi:hypothetical protein